MKVLYFARFRQIIGRGSDEITVPADVVTVGALLEHLAASDVRCAEAFSNRKIVRVAVDQNHVTMEQSILGAKEIAFFPPVTGG
jgi:molybdopterin synthase sulfur carrier subunit